MRVAHAPGMSGTFSTPPTSQEIASYRYRHASRHVRHARAVMHVGIANPRWRGKRSRHRRTRNPQFYVSGKRPIVHGNDYIGQMVLAFYKEEFIVYYHYNIYTTLLSSQYLLTCCMKLTSCIRFINIVKIDIVKNNAFHLFPHTIILLVKDDILNNYMFS